MRNIVQTDAVRSREAQAFRGASTLVKCLTELLTNSYESYQRLSETADLKKISPEILIIVNSQEESVEVIDHFEGLGESEEEIIAILEKKSRKQRTHTETSRSAMGRGMSDVLFRRSENVAILATRRNKKTFIYKCQYIPSLKFEGETDTEFTNQDGKDPFIFQKIEKIISDSGTYVKFFWKESVEDEKFPTKDKIKEMLGHYFELKNLLNDKKFTVNICYINKDGSQITEPVRFVKYDYDEIKTLGNRKLDITIPENLQKICKCGHENIKHSSSKCNLCICKCFVKKEYDIQILSATLYKSKTRLNVAEDDMRTQGLYIEGEHKQVYTMEFFGLEDRYPVEAPFYFGTVVLSKDAKNYMMDMYNFMKIEILTQTRNGFDKGPKNQLYHKIRGLLKPWLESVLKSQSHISFDQTDTSAKQGIEKLNEIMKKISEITDAKGIGQGGVEGKTTYIPEFAEFESKSYQIVKNKIQRIKLLVNPTKFKAGAKIEWNTTDSNLEIDSKFEHIPIKDTEVIKIPVIIKSSQLGDMGTIFVTLKTKDGKVLEPSPSALIECIEEKDIEVFKPHETIEFNPKTTSTKIFQSKSIDLYTHGNIVQPGTLIQVWFEPEPNHSRLEPIDIKNPISVEITAPEYNFNFNIENTETIQESGNYRKTTITFEGRQPGLNGIIKAKTVVDRTEYFAMCSISFASEEDGEKGGYFKHWKAERIGGDRSWVYENGIALANLSVPHVQKILGSSDNVAKSRFELYEEAKLFVANGMTSLAFEEAIINDFDGHVRDLEKQGLSSLDRYKHIMSKKNEWESLWTSDIFDAYEVKPRTQVPSLDQLHESKMTVQFPFEFKEYNVKSYFAGEKQIDNAFFDDSTLKHVKKRTDFVFKCMNEKMVIGVYEFENAICARFDSFDWSDEMDEVLLPIRDRFQIYRLPEIQPEGIPDNWVSVPVSVNLFQNNRLVNTPINLDNILKIPDSPRAMHDDMPYEEDDTWILENNKMILYKFYDDVISHKNFNDFKQLVCFIDSSNLHYIALNFFRLYLLRPMATHYYISHTVLPNTNTAECKRCHLKASSNESVKNSFGFYYDDKNAGISKFCRDHTSD